MSGQHLQIQAVNETRITVTGGSKANARVDPNEWATREISLGGGVDVQTLARIEPYDPVFVRKNTPPSELVQFGEMDSHVLCFAAFNGVLHHADDEFTFVGICASSPEHQNRDGPINQQLALWLDGTNTITFRSCLPFNMFDQIQWCIPRSADLPIDPTGAGRHLAELRPYEAGKSIFNVHRMHEMISRVAVRGETPEGHDNRRHQLPLKVWELLRAIGYTFVIAYKEIEASQNGQIGQISEAEKVFAGAVFGLTSSQGSNKAQRADADQKRAMFAQHALDSVFQMQTHPQSKKSRKVDGMTAFPLHEAGTQVRDVRTQEISRAQEDQIGELFQCTMTGYAAERRSIIGECLSGAVPGGKGDVLIRRE